MTLQDVCLEIVVCLKPQRYTQTDSLLKSEQKEIFLKLKNLIHGHE